VFLGCGIFNNVVGSVPLFVVLHVWNQVGVHGVGAGLRIRWQVGRFLAVLVAVTADIGMGVVVIGVGGVCVALTFGQLEV